jgi:hypothetical protein
MVGCPPTRPRTLSRLRPVTTSLRAGIASFAPAEFALLHKACEASGYQTVQFGHSGEVFGDDVVAAAMIDRLVHHAEVLALKETATDSKTETSAVSPWVHDATTRNNDPKVVTFGCR